VSAVAKAPVQDSSTRAEVWAAEGVVVPTAETWEPDLITSGCLAPEVVGRLIATAQESPKFPTTGRPELAAGVPAAFWRQLPLASLLVAWLYAERAVSFAYARALVATSTMRAQEETLSSVVRELAVIAEVLVLYHEFMVLAGSLAESD